MITKSKLCFCLGLIFGLGIAILVMNQSYEAVAEEVEYTVHYEARINDAMRDTTRESHNTLTYVLPANQAVNNEYFRQRVKADLLEYLEGSYASSDVFVNIIGYSECPIVK